MAASAAKAAIECGTFQRGRTRALSKPRALKIWNTTNAWSEAKLVRWRNELLMRFLRWLVALIRCGGRGGLLRRRLPSRQTSTYVRGGPRGALGGGGAGLIAR